MLEPLESRQLFSASLQANGDLFIAGTAKNDTVRVIDLGTLLAVYERVGAGKQVQKRFDAALVSRVVVTTKAGNDNIQLLYQKNIRAKISGGDGDDTLDGSGLLARQVLLGEAGDDNLLGGRGNDTLYGGDGNDSLTGNAGNDSIVGNLGADYILAGEGNDFIHARDKTVDRVIGGPGTDTAVLDYVIGRTPLDKLTDASVEIKL
jgi:Ca2+-binding RTX toxin-like protein